MNNIQRGHLTCYMEDISLLRSFGEGQRFTFSASIFRSSTNQPAIPSRRACAKQKEILFMSGTANWRTTAEDFKGGVFFHYTVLGYIIFWEDGANGAHNRRQSETV